MLKTLKKSKLWTELNYDSKNYERLNDSRIFFSFSKRIKDNYLITIYESVGIHYNILNF